MQPWSHHRNLLRPRSIQVFAHGWSLHVTSDILPVHPSLWGLPAQAASHSCIDPRGPSASRHGCPCCEVSRWTAPVTSPWNFASSSKERIKQAASDWHHQRFARISEETAYILLPEDGDAPVSQP
jgi:hypothetical protein